MGKRTVGSGAVNSWAVRQCAVGSEEGRSWVVSRQELGSEASSNQAAGQTGREQLGNDQSGSGQ